MSRSQQSFVNKWNEADSTAREALDPKKTELGCTCYQEDTKELWMAKGVGVDADNWRVIADNYRRGTAATALTSASAAVAWNMGSGIVYTHTMTENTTVAAPSNYVLGGIYLLYVTQHASAAKTLAFNAVFKAQGDITVDSTVSSTTAYLVICNSATSFILMRLNGDMRLDASPQLGANLDVNGKSFVSVSNGNIVFAPNGTGEVMLSGCGLITNTNESLTLAPNGTGDVVISGCSITTGTNEDLNLTPNGTGLINFMTNYQPFNAAVALTDGTVALDLSGGRIFTLLLEENSTLSAPTNAVQGCTYYLKVLQDGSGSRTFAFNAVYHAAGGAITVTATADHWDWIRVTCVDSATPVYLCEQIADVSALA